MSNVNSHSSAQHNRSSPETTERNIMYHSHRLVPHFSDDFVLIVAVLDVLSDHFAKFIQQFLHLRKHTNKVKIFFFRWLGVVFQNHLSSVMILSHAERPCARPGTFSLRGNSTNPCATEPPSSEYVFIYLFFRTGSGCPPDTPTFFFFSLRA